jgi:hypothetical protein
MCSDLPPFTDLTFKTTCLTFHNVFFIQDPMDLLHV